MCGGVIISYLSSSSASLLLPVERRQIFGSGGNVCECPEAIQKISHQDAV